MDRDIRLRPGVTVPASELSWRFSKSRGPGGQGVNTTDSKVALSWDLAGSPTMAKHPILRKRMLERLDGQLTDGVFTVISQESRSQLSNRHIAIVKLVAELLVAVQPPPRPRRPTKPTRSSQERRIQDKKIRGQRKHLRAVPDLRD